MKKIFAALAVSILAITSAQAAELRDVDGDSDGKVSMEEAKTVWPHLNSDDFTGADIDGDGLLDADEFATFNASSP